MEAFLAAFVDLKLLVLDADARIRLDGARDEGIASDDGVASDDGIAAKDGRP